MTIETALVVLYVCNAMLFTSILHLQRRLRESEELTARLREAEFWRTTRDQNEMMLEAQARFSRGLESISMDGAS